ncbi:hypothetical protein WJT74_00625 [Sphingomicrobium sp. XHP0239]|uniref:hypothetical protein n=1 Tax=Sphingomicrobium maritimum TaxID=3133972 RepID=UPI0031CC3D86
MFARIAAAWMTGLCVFAAAPAAAQDPDDEIIIEKRIEVDGQKAREQARDITARTNSYSEPMARFQGEICPGVWGLLEDNAQAVIDRIFANAEAADVPVNREPNCKANVWAIVVNDPAATYAELLEDNSPLVRTLSKAERNAVREQQGPVRAWNIVSTRDEDGNAVLTGFELAAEWQSAITNGTPPPSVPTSRMSRLHIPVRVDLELSVVLVARSSLGDIDSYALADYVTMRALARTQEPDELTDFDTVLSLFAEGRRADRMTTFDRAYLRSLYLSSAHRPSRIAMASLTKLMEEELNAGAPPEPR